MPTFISAEARDISNRQIADSSEPKWKQMWKVRKEIARRHIEVGLGTLKEVSARMQRRHLFVYTVLQIVCLIIINRLLGYILFLPIATWLIGISVGLFWMFFILWLLVIFVLDFKLLTLYDRWINS